MSQSRFLIPIFRALCLVAMLTSLIAGAQIDVDRVKISYVQHFIGFVHWQNSDRGKEVVLCSFTDSRLGRQMLEMLDSKSVAGSTISTRSLSLSNPLVAGCDVLFIPESLADFTPSLLARVGKAPVLTISDMEGFVNRGGMIGFVVDGDKLRFDVGIRAASGCGIGLSAKLLELARQVRR
ncbi:MAG: hypothetical protein H6R18_1571 [Proteobacteria bacterium]|nr:hypothetical protein [Pseudomonadota bacterium]